MKITVLGSAGQIGAYLTEYLKKKGHTVHEMDITIDPWWHDLTRHNNSHLMERLLDSDFCFFLAFDVGGSRYLKKYQHTYEFLDNNAKMMVEVFNQLKLCDVPFVFASSQMINMSHSPYGLAKAMGELYTKALGGLIVKFWNVYGIEKDMDKAHVITDFIRKGFEEGDFTMLTDGTEERQFLYAEDCCEALETIMENYKDFTSDDDLHITSFNDTTIKDVANIIQGQFNLLGKFIRITPGEEKDSVQLDKRNRPSTFIHKWWLPKTGIDAGIAKVFNEMKNDWV